jgi:hypothetical protein
LPFDIGFLGAPGCSIGADPLVVQTKLASAAGAGTFALFVPNVPALAGSVSFTQAIVVDAAANRLGFVTSDVGVMSVGSRF